MITSSLKKSYLRDGFVHIRKFFEEEEITKITRQVHDVFERTLKAKGWSCNKNEDGYVAPEDLFRLYDQHYVDYINCLRVVQNLPAIFSMGSREKLINTLKEIGICEPAFSSRPIITLMSERTSQHEGHWKLPPHQDWRSIQGSLNSVTVWISLSNVPKEYGPLELIPASHLSGLLPVRKDNWYMHIEDHLCKDEDFVPVETGIGDIIILSMFSVHRSGRNLSENHRYSLQLRYDDLTEPTFIRRSYPTNYKSDQPSYDLIDPGFPTQSELLTVFEGKLST